MLPRVMIEYLAIHEMVHLIEPHHNHAFWDKVEQILPDSFETQALVSPEWGELSPLAMEEKWRRFFCLFAASTQIIWQATIHESSQLL